MSNFDNIDDYSKYIGLVNKVGVTIYQTNTISNLNECMDMLNILFNQINAAKKNGKITEEEYKQLEYQISVQAKHVKSKIGDAQRALDESKSVSMYERVFNIIEQLSNEINECTDEDELATLRMKVTKLEELLQNPGVRNKLSTSEIDNLNENRIILQRIVRNREDFIEEAKRRIGSY